jgi:hypothetical protein
MDRKIVEIFIPGPEGRLEAKYYKSKKNMFITCKCQIGSFLFELILTNLVRYIYNLINKRII